MKVRISNLIARADLGHRMTMRLLSISFLLCLPVMLAETFQAVAHNDSTVPLQINDPIGQTGCSIGRAGVVTGAIGLLHDLRKEYLRPAN
jgi:hypothetical protein